MKREVRSSIDQFDWREDSFRRIYDFSRNLRDKALRESREARVARQAGKGVFIIKRPATAQEIRECFHSLAKRLCAEHPTISTNGDIYGGVPHIKNVRLSVGDILAKLYIYGNVQKIVDIYSPHVSEEQVKEAIAYAQDFLEAACAPHEPSEDND